MAEKDGYSSASRGQFRSEDRTTAKSLGSSAVWDVPGDVPARRPLVRSTSAHQDDLGAHSSSMSEPRMATANARGYDKREAVGQLLTVFNVQKYFRSSIVVPVLGVLMLVGLSGIGSHYLSNNVDGYMVAIAAPISTGAGSSSTLIEREMKFISKARDAQQVAVSGPLDFVATQAEQNKVIRFKVTNAVKQAPGYKLQVINHVVQKGDTLWELAEKYVKDPYRYPDLARQSNIRNPDLIYPGEVVRIEIQSPISNSV